MKPEDRDKAYLWDMLAAATEAQAMCRGLDAAAVAADRRTLLALERLMELVGEAARRVSPEVQRMHPGIPWRSIIGLRNVLAHEYGRVDHRLLFKAASVDAAELCVVLKRVLDQP